MAIKTKTAIWTIAALLVAAVAIIVLMGIVVPEPDDNIQGFVETTDYRVSSKVPARVMQIMVAEGDTVAAGDTLAILEAPEVEAKLQQAQAALEAAQAVERKANNGSRTEQVQQAYEMWQKAKAGLEVAQKTYERIDRLFQQGVMPEQKRDEARANYDAMLATERAAASQYEMARKGARAEDRDAAGAQTRRAQGAISEVSSYINETVLTASAPGVVTEIFPQVGELVGTGAPIMNIARVDDSWFTFNVREDRLPGLSVGTEIDVYLPALDKTVKAKVTRLKDVGSFAVWKATKATDGYDLKTFEVQAQPLQQSEIAGVRPGMSAVIVR